MRTTIIVAISALVLLAMAGGASAADRPVLGVAEFHNGATGVWWWGGGVGWELSGMLTNDLAATGSFTMVERSKLEPVLAEQDLADYGRIRPGTGAQVGKLTGSEYLVFSTVSAFEDNTKGTGGGIGYKGIRLGGKKKEAYMAVDLRVVNSTTGEVEYVRSVEARSGGRGFSVGVHRWGFSGNLAQHEKTPVGKAIRGVVIEIADYLECAMVYQDDCMAEYDAKERRRRQRTKSSIKLD
ncbi:MAG: CsgG/HfaB family protein [Thermoanaerobaculia bacterium]